MRRVPWAGGLKLPTPELPPPRFLTMRLSSPTIRVITWAWPAVPIPSRAFFCQDDNMKSIMTEQLVQHLQENEGKWVALSGPDGELEIVAVGADAAEASEQAAKLGHTETTLLKVLPSDAAYVPLS